MVLLLLKMDSFCAGLLMCTLLMVAHSFRLETSKSEESNMQNRINHKLTEKSTDKEATGLQPLLMFMEETDSRAGSLFVEFVYRNKNQKPNASDNGKYNINSSVSEKNLLRFQEKVLESIPNSDKKVENTSNSNSNKTQVIGTKFLIEDKKNSYEKKDSIKKKELSLKWKIPKYKHTLLLQKYPENGLRNQNPNRNRYWHQPQMQSQNIPENDHGNRNWHQPQMQSQNIPLYPDIMTRYPQVPQEAGPVLYPVSMFEKEFEVPIF